MYQKHQIHSITNLYHRYSIPRYMAGQKEKVDCRTVSIDLARDPYIYTLSQICIIDTVYLGTVDLQIQYEALADTGWVSAFYWVGVATNCAGA